MDESYPGLQLATALAAGDLLTVTYDRIDCRGYPTAGGQGELRRQRQFLSECQLGSYGVCPFSVPGKYFRSRRFLRLIPEHFSVFSSAAKACRKTTCSEHAGPERVATGKNSLLPLDKTLEIWIITVLYHFICLPTSEGSCTMCCTAERPTTFLPSARGPRHANKRPECGRIGADSCPPSSIHTRATLRSVRPCFSRVSLLSSASATRPVEKRY